MCEQLLRLVENNYRQLIITQMINKFLKNKLNVALRIDGLLKKDCFNNAPSRNCAPNTDF
jgi:hypothetical protein